MKAMTLKIYRFLPLGFLVGALWIPACRSSNSTGQTEKTDAVSPAIVPQPQTLVAGEGQLSIGPSTSIAITEDKALPLANLLRRHLERLGGFKLREPIKADNGTIRLLIDPALPEGGYRLTVEDEVILSGSDYYALANGSATLVQALRAEDKALHLPGLRIEDRPDYGYRSVMLDVARRWHPLPILKETIDLLWFYKIRYLHLHLSDNRRMAFPLVEFPKLKATNPDGSRAYYTREELEDLVAYARERGVIIIPEIDLPGHSTQLWRQYPEIFGSLDPKTGEPVNLYVVNMAKEEMYAACERIFGELAGIFHTSPYLHFGGDEVYLEAVKKVPEYQAYCEEHGLQAALEGDAEELFCHFINRMNDIVKGIGKKSLIWEGFHGLGAGKEQIAKDITVIVWNTTYNPPDALVRNGFRIINSTWIPWYTVGAMNLATRPEQAYAWDLNHWKHWDSNIEGLTIEKTASIIGGQLSFWEQTHYQVIPVLHSRLPVLAERLWNNANRDYSSFRTRFGFTDKRYKELFQPVSIEASGLLNTTDQTFLNQAVVHLHPRSEGQIRYQLASDWSLPEMRSGAVVNGPLSLKRSAVLTAQLFRGDQPVGYPLQRYYRKIDPIYRFAVLGPAPHKGWKKMPDFDQLDTILTGYAGRMTPERLEIINGELFAKVKTKGHIETRFGQIYNPYAVLLEGSIHIPESGEYELLIQTHDGLAELYINGQGAGRGQNFENEPEIFKLRLEAGDHPFLIKYFYRHIQNQLSIEYKAASGQEFLPFEDLVKSISIRK